jgi:hypothetical protein
VRLHERHLVDVLERAASAQERRRRPPEEDQRRLSELSILDRRDRVRDAGPSRDRRDPRHPGEAGDRIGSEHGGSLVAHVDDANSAGFRADEDGGDMAPAQRKKEPDSVPLEYLREDVTAMHGHAPILGFVGVGALS